MKVAMRVFQWGISMGILHEILHGFYMDSQWNFTWDFNGFSMQFFLEFSLFISCKIAFWAWLFQGMIDEKDGFHAKNVPVSLSKSSVSLVKRTPKCHDK